MTEEMVLFPTFSCTFRPTLAIVWSCMVHKSPLISLETCPCFCLFCLPTLPSHILTLLLSDLVCFCVVFSLSENVTNCNTTLSTTLTTLSKIYLPECGSQGWAQIQQKIFSYKLQCIFNLKYKILV